MILIFSYSQIIEPQEIGKRKINGKSYFLHNFYEPQTALNKIMSIKKI